MNGFIVTDNISDNPNEDYNNYSVSLRHQS